MKKNIGFVEMEEMLEKTVIFNKKVKSFNFVL